MNYKDHTNILEDIRGNSNKPDAEVDVFEPDAEYRAFGISRKQFGGEPIIDFITKDGNQQGFSYSHLYRVAFDPSKGITIEFTNHIATIQGQFLTDLYRYLLSQRVVYVTEADETTSMLQQNQQLSFVNGLSICNRTQVDY